MGISKASFGKGQTREEVECEGKNREFLKGRGYVMEKKGLFDFVKEFKFPQIQLRTEQQHIKDLKHNAFKSAVLDREIRMYDSVIDIMSEQRAKLMKVKRGITPDEEKK